MHSIVGDRQIFILTAAPDTSLGEIANLLERGGIKRVPILKDGRLVGELFGILGDEVDQAAW